MSQTRRRDNTETVTNRFEEHFPMPSRHKPDAGSDSLGTPWTLDFERDGTEDVTLIVDAEGIVLAVSRSFWYPEANEPVPITLAAMRLMRSAPEMHPLLVEAVEVLNAPTSRRPRALIRKIQKVLAVCHGDCEPPW